MDRCATRRVCRSPLSLHEHPGAKIDADHVPPAARAEPPYPRARPAADIESIIDLSEERHCALDQRVGCPERRQVEFGSEKIIAPLGRREGLSRQFEEGRATGMKHPVPDLMCNSPATLFHLERFAKGKAFACVMLRPIPLPTRDSAEKYLAG